LLSWASLLWTWEIFSLFKDIRPPHRSSSCHEQLLSFPPPSFDGFTGTTTTPPAMELLFHPQPG
jgi:hypothetical protein